MSSLSITTNDGVKLAYSKTGENGPNVLLIHGWSGSRQYFRDSVQDLAKQCQVYAYDLRGHGDSDKPTWGAHVARLAGDLRDFLIALDLKEVVVVGTSLGCAIIWSYIELFGNERLGKAVFVDQAPLQFYASDWKLGSNALRMMLKYDFDAFAKGTAEGCMQRPPTKDTAAFLISETKKADASFLGALMADHTQLDWRPLLPRITLPCLVMVGKKSQCFPWQGVQYVADNIKGSKVEVYEEGDHWLYIEEPQRFSSSVIAFATQ
eukprot:gene5001-6091_t